jgi:hypothetical protein
MHLRQNTRAPGRYREDSVESLPPNPKHVHPTIPFDPTLRPAVFPTLELDQYPPEFSHNDTTPYLPATRELESPALVFKDQRTSTVTDSPNMESLEGPGEFDGYDMWDDHEEETKIKLTVYQCCLIRFMWLTDKKGHRWHVDWCQFSDGIKLMIIWELCNFMPFQAAVSFLQLGDGEIDEFIGIVDREKVRETSRQAEEARRLTRINERQHKLLERYYQESQSGVYKSGGYQYPCYELNAVLEEELFREQVLNPAAFSFGIQDIRVAQYFLLDFRCREEFEPFCREGIKKHRFDHSELIAIPTREVHSEVINRLNSYAGVTCTKTDFKFAEKDFDLFREAREMVQEHNVSDIAAEEEEDQRERFEQMEDFKKPERLNSLHQSQRQGHRELQRVNGPSALASRKLFPKKRDSKRRPSNRERELILMGLKTWPPKTARPRIDNDSKTPSRLREVTNADETQIPWSPSPLSCEAFYTASNSPATMVGSTPQNQNPTHTSMHRRISSIGRNPFEHDLSRIASENGYRSSEQRSPQNASPSVCWTPNSSEQFPSTNQLMPTDNSTNRIGLASEAESTTTTSILREHKLPSAPVATTVGVQSASTALQKLLKQSIRAEPLLKSTSTNAHTSYASQTANVSENSTKGTTATSTNPSAETHTEITHHYDADLTKERLEQVSEEASISKDHSPTSVHSEIWSELNEPSQLGESRAMLKPVSNKNSPKAVSHLLEMPHRKSLPASINHEQGKGLFVKMKDRFVGAITGSKPSSAKGEDLSLGKTDDTVKVSQDSHQSHFI